MLINMKDSAIFPQSEMVFARLGRDLSATASAAAAAESILNAANELIGWDACYLVLYDPQRGGKPRPLLTMDTVEGRRMVEHDVAPETPSENMLRAIRDGGFLSLYEEPFSLPSEMTFGDRSRRTLSQLFVAVRSDRRTIGVLSIQSYQIHAYSDSSLETLKILANHCAGALERIWAQEALAQMVERLKVMYQAARAISASLDIEELCDAIHATVEQVMPCDDFVIDGYDPEPNKIVPIYAIEYPRRRVETAAYTADHGMGGYIAHSGKSLLLNSIEEMDASGIDFEFYGSEGKDNSQSIVAVPMLLKGSVIGIISAQSYQPNAYTHEDQYLLELLASHAAIAIENSRLFAAVQSLADTDALTGAFSRRKFFELAEREFQRAKRYGETISALMIDIDEFKKFNDWFGHQTGDLILHTVSARCSSVLRQVDVFGRLGGEEFAVILPDTALAQAVLVATRLGKLVEDTQLNLEENRIQTLAGRVFGEDALKVTISVGIACLDESCKNIDILLDRADRAMYAGKHAGRNQINIWKY